MNTVQVLSLILVFAAFCGLMGWVLRFCQIERARAQTEGPEGEARAEKRIAMMLPVVIAAGAALAIITAYLVFFRNWG